MKKNEIIDGIVDIAMEKAFEAGTEVIERLKQNATGTDQSTIAPNMKNAADTDPCAVSDLNPHNRTTKVKNRMTEAEQVSFINNIATDLTAAFSGQIVTPQQALDAVKTLVTTAGEVVKFCELQETERSRIESERQRALAIIDAQKQFLITYLDRTFDERKEQFNCFFKIVDDALAKNNIQELMLGLNNINQLAASSPFKNLQDIKASLENKGTVWEF